MKNCLPYRLRSGTFASLLAGCVLAIAAAPSARADDALPEFSKVSEGFTEISSSDQQDPKGLFNVWKNEKRTPD